MKTGFEPGSLLSPTGPHPSPQPFIGQIGKFKKSPWDKEEGAQVDVPKRPRKVHDKSKAEPTSVMWNDVLGPEDL